MPTSYTALLGLALPVTGELSGTWGDVVSNYITQYVDSAVAGTQTISGTQTAVTLSVTNGSSLVTAGSGSTGSAQFQIINCTGNPAGLLTITAPASSRQYIIINATSTSQSVKIVGTGPTTGVTLISGEKAHVAWNGSDFVKIATTAAAGGSNTQVQYNSSGVLAGSSNMTFDGTNLTVGGTASATKLIPTGGAATGNGMYLPTTNELAWSVNGSEGMRLTSTGLGIGTSSPIQKFVVSNGGAAGVEVSPTGGSQGGTYLQAYNRSGAAFVPTEIIASKIGFYTGSSPSLSALLDSSGNLGLGVTPSSWSVPAGKIIEVGTVGNSIWGVGASNMVVGSNIYYASSSYKYANTGSAASAYQQAGGVHYWYNAASGTAGNTITFTTAMTLDASGNLLLGGTSTTQLDGVFGQIIGSSSKTSAGLALETQYGAYLIYTDSADALIFWDSGSNAERARITSGGYFKASNTGSYIGSTSSFHETVSNSTSDGVLVVESTSTSYTSYILSPVSNRNTTNNTYYAIGYFHRGAGAYKFLVADSGNVTNTNGSYGTISDVKMKTDIVDAGSQWADIKAIRFRKFKMKDDPEQIVQLGVVAQEVEQTSPGLVEEHQDRNEKGESLGTTTKSVKTSVLLMKAAVALQEAMTRIEQLEAKVAALESKGA